MSEKKRTILNLITFITLPLLLGIVNMFKASIFINLFGKTGNGTYNIYTQFFTYFAFVESGIEMSLSSLLYKHLAKKEYDEANALLKGGRVYWKKFGMLNGCICLALLPFAPFIVKGTGYPFYMLLVIQASFSFKSLLGYIFSGPHAIAMADNKGYYIAIIDNSMNMIASVVAIVAAFMTHNIMYTVLIEVLVITLITAGKYVFLRGKFPWYNKNYQGIADFTFVKSLKATLINKVSEMVINGTDLVVAGMMISAAASSSFSIYIQFAAILFSVFGSALISSLQSFLGKRFSALSDNVEEKKSSIRLLFLFNNLILFSIIPTLIFGINQFIILFYPQGTALGLGFYLTFFAAFYFRLYRTPYNTLKISLGNYNRFSRISLFDAALKLLLTFLFAYYFGVIGIVISTPIAYMLTDMVMDMRVIDFEILGESRIISYLKTFLLFILTMCVGYFAYANWSAKLTNYFTLFGSCALMVAVLLSIGLVGALFISKDFRHLVNKRIKQ